MAWKCPKRPTAPALFGGTLYSLSTSRWYRFTVGNKEGHAVEIEKVRKWVLAGFREQYIRVYIDGDLRSGY